MADEVKTTPSGNLSDIVRAAKYKEWNGDKYGRMAIYVLLYNKVKDMPKGYGFSNNVTSGMVRDYIRDNFDFLIRKFNLDELPGLQFGPDQVEEKDNNGNPVLDAKGNPKMKDVAGAGKKKFLAELDEYNQYALEIGKTLGKSSKDQMPDPNEMVNFIDEVRKNRSKQYENLRKSVKVEPGENYSGDKNNEGYLIAERYAKIKQISEAKRLMRRTGGKTVLMGLLSVGSVALTVGSAMLMLTPGAFAGIAALKATSVLGRVVMGVFGCVAGATGVRGFGGKLFYCFGKLHGQHHKIEDLKNKYGVKGKDRGLKEIEKHISINRELLSVFNELSDIKTKDKNGNFPFIKVQRKSIQKRDEHGNLMFEIVKGPDGQPVYEMEYDAHGNKVPKIERDEHGNPVYVQKKDANGKLLFDALHNPVYEQETDASGKPVFDASGKPVYKTQKVVKKKPIMMEIDYKYEYPSKEEFYSYIKKHHKLLWKYRESEDVQLDKTYARAKEYFLANKGTMFTATEFVGHNQTTVIRNNEIALERDAEYEKYFGLGSPNDSFSASLNNTPNTPVSSELSTVKSEGLRNFVQTLTRFAMDKKAYEKSEDGLRYSNMEANAAEMLPLMFQNEIFDMPYTGDTFRNCSALLENEIVKRFLKECRSGDKTSYVKNALAFINLESLDKDPVMSIKQGEGWTIKQQLSMDAETIENACAGFGVDKSSPEYSTIQDIALGIENMVYREDANRLKGLLASVGNEQSKRYLSVMIDKRIKESGIGQSEIFKRIGHGTTQEEIDVRNNFITLLNSVSYDKDKGDFYFVDLNGNRKNIKEFSSYARTNLSYLGSAGLEESIKMFNEHIEAIERRNTNKIRAKAADAIRANTVNFNIDDMLTKIRQLSFESLNSNETLNYYYQEICRVQPPEVKDYLTLKLQQKVEMLFRTKLSRNDIYKEANGLDLISSDMKIIGGLTYLNQDQKNHIFDMFGPHIDDAFTRKVRIMKFNILNNNENKDYRSIIDKYFNLDVDGGGFKDFFGSGTEFALSAKAKLQRIADGLTYSTYFKAPASGIKEISDPGSPETRIFLKLYFRDTKSNVSTPGSAGLLGGDKLFETLSNIRAFFNGLDFNTFTEDGFKNEAAANKVFEKMQAYLAGQDSLSGGTSLETKFDKADKEDLKDEMAAFLIFKKNVIAQFKSHLTKYINPHSASPVEYAKVEGRETLNKIIEKWKPIFVNLDKKYEELKGLIGEEFNQFTGSGDTYIPAMSILSSVTQPANLNTYVNNSSSTLEEYGMSM